MKKALVAILALFCSLASIAQDQIITVSQDTVVCKVLETNPRQVVYVLWQNQTGAVHKLDLKKVDRVIYQGGKVDDFRATRDGGTVDGIVFNNNVSNYELGYQDAERYYKGYRAASIVAILGGLVPSIIMSSVRPDPRTFVVPNRKMWEDAEYRRGYSDSAREIKKDKVWTNYAWGIAIKVGFYLVMLAVALAAL